MSAQVRAYLPLGRDHLVDLSEGHPVPAGADVFYVSDAMRHSVVDSDEEELEFKALQQAAQYAIAAGRPVIIAAVDLPQAALASVADSPGVTAVELTTREVVSLHLSDHALTGSAEVEPDPHVEDLEAVDLSWFDITELPDVLKMTQ